MQSAQVLGKPIRLHYCHHVTYVSAKSVYVSVKMASKRPSSSEIQAAVEASAYRLGFQHLREEQKEAVVSFVSGKDVLVLLPTGSGKSLCYSLLPWTFDKLRQTPNMSIVVVVSPLVSLMTDQSNSTTEMGIPVAVWSTDLRNATGRQENASKK